jgi:hypothetical protein
MRECQTEINQSKKGQLVQPSLDSGAVSAFVPQSDVLAHMVAGTPRPESHAEALKLMTSGHPWLARKSILHLQRDYGNRYVQCVLALARQGEGEAEVAPDVEVAIDRSRGGGQSLDTGVRRQMESAFGTDFSGVRIHTGAESHSLNRAVNAIAFTTGEDIFFRDGAYNPGTSSGKELLAHELTHVMQQGATSHVSTKAQCVQVQRLCSECEKENDQRIQGKLSVGRADDQYEQEADRVAKLAMQSLDSNSSTRDPDQSASGDEIATVNGDGGVLDGGSSDGGDGGALDGGSGDGGVPMVAGGGTPASNCTVLSGPAYAPTGNIPVSSAGGRKSAPFSFAASFSSDSATGKLPSCCEVHQFIKWDTAFHNANGGPPHSGFPSSAAANTWIEDRDSANKRYGHRSDSFSDPISGCGDEYKTGTTQDQVNGDKYCGKDAPGGPAALTGQWQFRLDAVDTCNGNAVKASSSVITVNW